MNPEASMPKFTPVVLLLTLVLGCLSLSVAAEDEARPAGLFDELLAESGMEFNRPGGFETAPVQSNPLLPYEHAIRSSDGMFEIRYALRPLGRIQIDYEDPHSSAPDPNHMFPLMFQSLVTSLSDGTHSPTREYTPEQASTQFNAHWAAAALFDVNPDFNSEHRQALILALHKNQLADAYAVLLFDDYEHSRDAIKANLGLLKFLP